MLSSSAGANRRSSPHRRASWRPHNAVAAADEANDRHVQTREKTRRPRSGAAKASSERNKRVARPNRGNWKNQF